MIILCIFMKEKIDVKFADVIRLTLSDLVLIGASLTFGFIFIKFNQLVLIDKLFFFGLGVVLVILSTLYRLMYEKSNIR